MDVDGLWSTLERSVPALISEYRDRVRAIDVRTKPDGTLLTDADTAVQTHIIDMIRQVDPLSGIVAEELEGTYGDVDSRHLWVIDPIDGTAQFVRPDRIEFCTVVCLMEHHRPVAACVLAPELADGSLLSVRCAGPDSPVLVNGQVVSRHQQMEFASVTRSSSSLPRPWEHILEGRGLRLKTSTTSQTLDMVRTCIDISSWTEPPLPAFGIFYREKQKVWDGVAGMALARAVGLTVADGRGTERDEVTIELRDREPTFDSTLVLPRHELETMVSLLQL